LRDIHVEVTRVVGKAQLVAIAAPELDHRGNGVVGDKVVSTYALKSAGRPQEPFPERCSAAWHRSQ
jgi:hypothetical protein